MTSTLGRRTWLITVGAGEPGHRGDALGYGLQTGLPLLYQRFGLAPP